MYDYNQANRHARDSRIFFDGPTHTYHVLTDEGERVECESVTTVIDNCFAHFDAEKWAALKATPEHPAEAILDEWERKGQAARDAGTLMHERIERFYLGYEPDDEALDDEAFCHFLRFKEVWHLIPYRSEWRIFSEKYRIAGTLDFLACNDGVFEIFDWKRSAKIVDHNGQVQLNSFGKHAFAPLEHIPDTTYHHYALQVSLYRYILETEYGITVESGRLGTFHPSYSKPHVVALPYLRDEVVALLNYRHENLA